MARLQFRSAFCSAGICLASLKAIFNFACYMMWTTIVNGYSIPDGHFERFKNDTDYANDVVYMMDALG